jgi:F-type H+-transporting ATPase subunit epsilon
MKGTGDIQLTVLSPSRTVLETMVSKVTLPASKGRFMVLRDHAPVISSLDEGDVVYETASGQVEKLHVLSGFVEVCDNVVTVCAEV